MIYLFTGITQNSPQYKRDFLNTCCQNSGSRISYGYKDGRIADTLKAKQNDKGLQGEKALIVFYEQKSFKDANGNPELRIIEYHPIRLATIVAVHSQFREWTFELQLEEFFDYNKGDADVKAAMAEFQKHVLTTSEQPTPQDAEQPKVRPTFPRGGNDSRKFVCERSNWREAEFAGEWEPLIRHLIGTDDLAQAIFFQFRVIPFPTGKPLFAVPNDSGLVTYSLESGASYQVSAKVRAGKNAKHKGLELSVNGVASAIGPLVRQHGSGFQADFIIDVKRSFEIETSIFLLKVPDGAADAPAQPGQAAAKAVAKSSDEVRSPEFQALLRISAPGYLLPLVVGLLSIGALLISLPPELIKEVSGGQPAAGTNANLLFSNALLISMILKGIGTVVVGIGTYLGFRKLPK